MLPEPQRKQLQRQPTGQCSRSAPNIYLRYVSWLRMCHLFTVLTSVIFQRMKLNLGIETIITRAELKDHSDLEHLLFSDLQIITSDQILIKV